MPLQACNLPHNNASSSQMISGLVYVFYAISEFSKLFKIFFVLKNWKNPRLMMKSKTKKKNLENTCLLFLCTKTVIYF